MEKMEITHEELIKRHLGSNTSDWTIENVQNLINELLENDGFVYVHEQEPPKDLQVLSKSPDGIIRMSSWRRAYNIFDCQAKSESSYNWQWKFL